MKRLLSLVAFFATLQASAQQVNPVPDYVFRNQMSVGRNAVTDTAAYFSIGPRYGATKGFMPPIVGDTATFSSGKRNGLLIFSVQKNKFLYWDSVRVQWSDMAGGSGSYILAGDTSAMLAPYLRKADTTSMLTAYLRKGDTSSMLGNYVRHAGYGLTKSGQSFLVDTLNIATRAWRQKGLDSLAALEVSGSGTTNYVPKFTAGSTIGNSQIFDNGTNVGIGITSPATFVHLQKNQNAVTTLRVENTDTTSSGARANISVKNVDVDYHITSIGKTGAGINAAYAGTNSNHTLYLMTNGTARQTIFANGRIGINTTTDAGYQLDVAGSIRSTTTIRSDGNFYNESASPIYTAQLNTAAGQRVLMQMSGTDGELKVTRSSGTQPNLVFSTEGGEKMRITAAGNVGINQNSPSYLLDINGTLRSVNGANFATTSGNVGIGTTVANAKLHLLVSSASDDGLIINNGTNSALIYRANTSYSYGGVSGNSLLIYQPTNNLSLFSDGGAITFHNGGTPAERGRFNTSGELLINTTSDAGDYKLQVSGNIYNTGSAVLAATSGEVLIGTTTDAGDYKLQVVGNARVGTGKLDIASNTTFGLGVARSGTSEVAGQIYNSNGILYLGAESSAGGQIFSGSSAYAAVIGSGANYPLQFATNNITRATMTTSGNLLLGFTTDSYFLKLQVNGSIFSNNQILAQGVNAQIAADSTTNASSLYISNQSLTGSSAQGLFYGSTTWNTTGNPSLIDLAITNTASGSDANYIKISDGSNIFRVTKAAEVVTAAPTGGSIRKWKLGEAATVSPTSPNRTIRVEIDGTVYYLHAKTTND